jgi:hypothetical protein
LCDAGIPVLCDPANITFTVTVNDAPIVDNDVNTTTEDTPVWEQIDQRQIATQTEHINSKYNTSSGPTKGTIVIDPDGTYVYTPAPKTSLVQM